MDAERNAAECFRSKMRQTDSPSIADGWQIILSTFAPDAVRHGC